MLIKIIIIGVIAVVLNLILKEYKPEFAMLINVCAGLLIFSLAIKEAEVLLNDFIGFSGREEINGIALTPILKIVGLGYITEFAADLAEESGNKSVAGKIILGGKIALCTQALPVIKNLINAILSLV